ncbi:MAG: penicillin-binding transpeptidase domain-containing protein, partial [Candidatus Paceibacteria bacterium]
YFGKSADELSVHEAATLATLPRAPSYYSPYGGNREALKARQQAILKIMEQKGFITQKELENNLDKKISVEPFNQDIKAPHFVFYVRNILSQKLGQKRLQKGGLRVTTTLDYELHQKAQEIVKKHVEEEVEAYGGSNAALGAVDPKTGDILTMVGSRDYYSKKIDGQVNILSSLQSPGSSMKPFVYGSGFEKGYNPQTNMFDVPTNFGGGYRPENFDGEYRGPVSIRTALVRSLNIPAVKALHLTGIGDYFKFARDLGISNYTSSVMQEASLSAAIGGASLKPIEEIGAYGTLADSGMHDPLTAIKSVKTNQGTVPEPFKDRREERRVIEKQAALQVTDILSEASGVPSSMQISGVDVASKTGTSQDFRDSLTMGYTTNLAAGVWTGNNDNTPMNQGAYGSKVAGPMWKDFMQTALDHLESSPERFEEPVPANTDKPMLNGEYVFKETVKVNRLTGKRASENTPPQLVEERTYKQVHNIL